MLSCETHISSSRFLSSSKPMYGRQYGSTAKRSESGFFYLFLCVWQSERRKKKEALDILHDNITDFETWRNVPWERERERYTTPRDTFISAPFRHHPRLSRGKNPIYGTRRGTCRHSAYIHWLIWSRQANHLQWNKKARRKRAQHGCVHRHRHGCRIMAYHLHSLNATKQSKVEGPTLSSSLDGATLGNVTSWADKGLLNEKCRRRSHLRHKLTTLKVGC